MITKRQAPYGTWLSPVTTDLVTGQTIGFAELTADGSDLYWLENRPAEQGRSVLVRRRADGDITDLTPPPFNVEDRVHEYGGGAYTVQRGRIAFSNRRDGSVWLIDGAAAPRRITAVDGCRYADFRFLQGGQALVCVREDHRNRPATDPEAALVALDLSGRVPPEQNDGRVLVRGPDFLAAPRPSPDGRHLAWIAWSHPDMPWDATALWVGQLGGDGAVQNARMVAGGADESVIHPAWSPDGVLHFSSDRSDWWNIYRWRNGAIETVAAVDGEIGGAQWGLGNRYFAFLPGGRLIAALTRNGRTEAVEVADGALRPLAVGQVQSCPAVLDGPGAVRLGAVRLAPDKVPAVVIADAGGADVRVIRTAAPEVLSAADIAVGEAIAFPTSAGETAHAFWYPPTNAAFEGPPAEKPPLVVMVHGGPTSMTTNGFAPRIQWFTSRGFGVVDVNYRGSTGYGRAYRKRLDGQWGVYDVADCIAAAEHLVRTARVDGARLTIRGGSAGGFTALAVLTSSVAFSAAASLYGVADLKLLAGETHKFEARYLDRLIGPLPAAEALYAARSPINHIDRLRCGVIFFQGLEDRVVPPNQSREMAEAIHARGLPVALYEFAGEHHGFRKADSLRRVLELELDFYGRLLGFTPPDLSERVRLMGEA